MLSDLYLEKAKLIADPGQQIEQYMKALDCLSANKPEYCRRRTEVYLDLAFGFQKQGNKGRADSYAGLVEPEWNRAFGGWEPLAASQLARLAQFRLNEHKVGEAQRLLNICIAGLSLRYGGSHIELAPFYEELADLYLQQGRLQDSIELLQKTLSIMNSSGRTQDKEYFALLKRLHEAQGKSGPDPLLKSG